MSDNFSSHPHYHSNEKTSPVFQEVAPSAKVPRLILEDIFVFAPNRETLGGTAYLIISIDCNILIDCPLWNEINRQFCQQQGGG
jgi:hypothetical protein